VMVAHIHRREPMVFILSEKWADVPAVCRNAGPHRSDGLSSSYNRRITASRSARTGTYAIGPNGF